jgi:hypothetical protein
VVAEAVGYLTTKYPPVGTGEAAVKDAAILLYVRVVLTNEVACAVGAVQAGSV